MVCDCAARSSEFGSDVREWFAQKATHKYSFNIDSEVGLRIIYYLDLLLEKPFK
jgi:hypothetical protein